jgi:hypothetical protein
VALAGWQPEPVAALRLGVLTGRLVNMPVLVLVLVLVSIKFSSTLGSDVHVVTRSYLINKLATRNTEPP